MYATAKISPPANPMNSNGFANNLNAGRDTGFSSTTHRNRNDSNGRSNPVTPTALESGSLHDTPPLSSSSLSSSSSSSSSLAQTLFGLKKGRLLYSSSLESPKSPKRRGKGKGGCLGLITESRWSPAISGVSVLLNILMVALLLLSYTNLSPLCVGDPSAALQEHDHHHRHDDDSHNGGEVFMDTEYDRSRKTPTPEQRQEDAAANKDHVQEDEAEKGGGALQPQPAPAPAPAPAAPEAAPVFFETEFSDAPYTAAVHAVAWKHCLRPPPSTHLMTLTDEEKGNITGLDSFPLLYCPVTPTVEQSWQVGWYGGQVAVNGGADRHLPNPQQCVHLPPVDYQWPSKYTELPSGDNLTVIHWPNLRVSNFQDLIVFNQGTPKNLYHFNAPQYDHDGFEELSLGAAYIPFDSKVRTFLDIGAGGGSLGLLLRRKFGVEAMSIIFPDWPYCEYITERGGLCVLVDVMEAMPFAHWSFDAVHISWVYHGQQPHELTQMYTEIDRIVRPGGYVWQRGGWSWSQIKAQKALFDALGYTLLHEKIQVKPEDITKRISFGTDLPFEAEWWCIYVKPIRAQRQDGCDSAPEIQGPA